MVLRALICGTGRAQLLRILIDGQDAVFPHEGRILGTWDQVVLAFAKGFLNPEEFEEITRAVGR